MFCKYCGTKIAEELTECPNCGASKTANVNVTVNVPREDKASVGFSILSFLFPLFGFIYGGVKYKETPNAAKTYLICAGVSVGLSLLTSIIGSVIAASAFGSFLNAFTY